MGFVNCAQKTSSVSTLFRLVWSFEIYYFRLQDTLFYRPCVCVEIQCRKKEKPKENLEDLSMDEHIIFRHVKERVCECVELPRRTQDRILWHPLLNT